MESTSSALMYTIGSSSSALHLTASLEMIGNLHNFDSPLIGRIWPAKTIVCLSDCEPSASDSEVSESEEDDSVSSEKRLITNNLRMQGCIYVPIFWVSVQPSIDVKAIQFYGYYYHWWIWKYLLPCFCSSVVMRTLECLITFLQEPIERSASFILSLRPVCIST